MRQHVMKWFAAGLLAVGLCGCRSGADFSPDGKSLVTIYKERLAIIDVHSGAIRHTFGSGSSTEPLWSPDGRYILYSDGTNALDNETQLSLYDVARNRSSVLRKGTNQRYI